MLIAVSNLFRISRFGFRIFILSVFLQGCAVLLPWKPYPPLPLNQKPQGVFRGIYHVHTQYSPDSKASLEQVVKTAEAAVLDFVVVTDHNSKDGERTYEKGMFPRRPLLIFGEEISTAYGHMIALHASKVSKGKRPEEIIREIQGQDGLAFIAHPLSQKNPWKNPALDSYDGLEVYNAGHQFYPANKFLFAAELLFLPPGTFLKAFHKTPENGLAFWDERSAERENPLPAVAAADAHLRWKWLAGSKTYLLAFQSTTLYVRAGNLAADEIIRALGRGESYIAFEFLGPAPDFTFFADAEKKTHLSGDVFSSTQAVFHAHAPEKALIHLLHNGRLVAEREGLELVYPASEPSIYRAEVYKDGKIWIISNPIYWK